MVVEFDSCATQYEETVDRSVSFTGRDSVFFAGRKVEVLEEILGPELGPLRTLSVLDVGCGTGTTTPAQWVVVRTGSSGLELGACTASTSPRRCSKARDHVPDTEYRWYDGEKLPFPDESFDVVVTICVLHHVPISKRFKFVSEMVRVTRAQGVVAIFEHNPMNPLTRRAVNSCEFDKDAVLLSSDESLADVEGCRRDSAAMFATICSLPSVVPSVACSIGASTACRFGGQYVAWARRPLLQRTGSGNVLPAEGGATVRRDQYRRGTRSDNGELRRHSGGGGNHPREHRVDAVCDLGRRPSGESPPATPERMAHTARPRRVRSRVQGYDAARKDELRSRSAQRQRWTSLG